MQNIINNGCDNMGLIKVEYTRPNSNSIKYVVIKESQLFDIKLYTNINIISIIQAEDNEERDYILA